METLMYYWVAIESNMTLFHVFCLFVFVGCVILGVRECYNEHLARRKIVDEIAKRVRKRFKQDKPEKVYRVILE